MIAASVIDIFNETQLSDPSIGNVTFFLTNFTSDPTAAESARFNAREL